MVVFEQGVLYLVKSGCIRAVVVVFGHISCILARWFYSGKVVVFVLSGGNRTK